VAILFKSISAFRAISILVFAIALIAQSKSARTQESATWNVSNIGDVINTSDFEAFPTIAPNGLAIYFSRASSKLRDGGEATAWWEVDDWDIFVSERPSLDAAWGIPRRLPDHINTNGWEHSVTFSTDGHWMYFSSDQLDSLGQLDIFRSYRDDITDEFGWGMPENLGPNVNTPAHDVCVIYYEEPARTFVSLYFVSSREGSRGEGDIWHIAYTPETETYSEAKRVTAVSSSEFDGHLDPKFGYIWSERKGGLGSSDIWQSSRDAEGNWLPPVNLGPQINTAYEEQLPSPTEDGRMIFFPSDRPGGYGNLDIYVAEKVTGT
jgi:hypothetical protein